MKNAAILHGTDFEKTRTQSKNNWFPWLKKELKDQGYQVWLPELPDADRPNVCTYNIFLDDNYDFDDETIMIGHSSGSTSILGWLNKIPENRKIKTAILVAGFKDNLGISECDGLFTYDFDWNKLKKMADEYILIYSDDDPYVPLEHGKYFKEKLGDKAELIIIKGQKHFSIGSFGEKYRQFPELLKYL